MLIKAPPSVFKENKNENSIIKAVPLYVQIVSFASLFITIGIVWDISWHITIGRDKFFSPPHLLIYIGATVSGLFSGIQLLKNTFASATEAKKSLIKVWCFFYSSLGGLFCIWGALAMLTSAPLDDWWHNAYGLDVTTISPPHSLLILGILFLQIGACISISKYLNLLNNRHMAIETGADYNANKRKRQIILKAMFVLTAASLLCFICTFMNEYLQKKSQRNSSFYEAASIIILLFLPAFGRLLRFKWGVTTIAISYFLLTLSCNCILQLFPAVPKLSPVLNPVTHLQPLDFPLLIFVPAISMDLIMQKVKSGDWIKSAFISIFFIVLLFAVQYPLSGFLVESAASRNLFFGSKSWSYSFNPDWPYRYKFPPWELQPRRVLIKGLVIAVISGFFVCRLSLQFGKWMQNIQR